MRLIDADALMKEFAEFVKDSNNSDFADAPTWNDAVSLVGSAPTIEERKKGKWRNIQIGKWLGVECTACKIAHDRREVPHGNGGEVAWKFCPECGADMRGGKE